MPLKMFGGVVKYGTQNRLQFLQQDGRKSYVGYFARWDRLVQANELCRTRWSIEDLSNLPELLEVVRYFS